MGAVCEYQVYCYDAAHDGTKFDEGLTDNSTIIISYLLIFHPKTINTTKYVVLNWALKSTGPESKGSGWLGSKYDYAWAFATTRTTRVRSSKAHRIKASMGIKRKTVRRGRKSQQNRDWQKHTRASKGITVFDWPIRPLHRRQWGVRWRQCWLRCGSYWLGWCWWRIALSGSRRLHRRQNTNIFLLEKGFNVQKIDEEKKSCQKHYCSDDQS